MSALVNMCWSEHVWIGDGHLVSLEGIPKVNNFEQVACDNHQMSIALQVPCAVMFHTL